MKTLVFPSGPVPSTDLKGLTNPFAVLAWVLAEIRGHAWNLDRWHKTKIKKGPCPKGLSAERCREIDSSWNKALTKIEKRAPGILGPDWDGAPILSLLEKASRLRDETRPFTIPRIVCEDSEIFLSLDYEKTIETLKKLGSRWDEKASLSPIGTYDPETLAWTPPNGSSGKVARDPQSIPAKVFEAWFNNANKPLEERKGFDPKPSSPDQAAKDLKRIFKEFGFTCPSGVYPRQEKGRLFFDSPGPTQFQGTGKTTGKQPSRRRKT